MTARPIIRFLVVDDSPSNRQLYSQKILERPEGATIPDPIDVEVAVASDVDQAKAKIAAARERGLPFDVLLTDFFLGPNDASRLLIDLKNEFASGLRALVVSQTESKEAVHQRLRPILEGWPKESGLAPNVILRGNCLDDFIEEVWKDVWIRILDAARSSSRDESDASEAFVTADPSARKMVKDFLERVKNVDQPVLILGESGTGKGALARAIHDASNRNKERFERFDLAAYGSELCRTYLVGCVKGAYTGAVDRIGLIEALEGGTLFVDEIGDASLELQATLRTVVGEQTFRPDAATRSKPCDVRWILATNKNLEVEVAEGRFRSDLLKRIDFHSIRLPALRDRLADVPALIIELWGRQNRPEKWTDEALGWMVSRGRNFEGNVRPLSQAIDYLAAVLPRESTIDKPTLESYFKDVWPRTTGGSSLERTRFGSWQQEVLHRWFAPLLEDPPPEIRAAKSRRSVLAAKLRVVIGSYFDGTRNAEESILSTLDTHFKSCPACSAAYKRVIERTDSN